MSRLLCWFKMGTISKKKCWVLKSRIITNVVIQMFWNLIGWYSCVSRSLRLMYCKKKSKYARIFSKVNSNIESLHLLIQMSLKPRLEARLNMLSNQRWQSIKRNIAPRLDSLNTKRPQHMTTEFQILDWDMHKNVAWLSKKICRFTSLKKTPKTWTVQQQGHASL
jgi:hypothetical protein